MTTQTQHQQTKTAVPHRAGGGCLLVISRRGSLFWRIEMDKLEYMAQRYAEAIVAQEVEDYDAKFEVEDVQVYDGKDGVVDVTVDVEGAGASLYLRISQMKPIINGEVNYADCKAEVCLNDEADNYEEFRLYDHTAKYFWMALLRRGW